MLIGNSSLGTTHGGNSAGLSLEQRGVVQKETLSHLHAKRLFPSGSTTTALAIHQQWSRMSCADSAANSK